MPIHPQSSKVSSSSGLGINGRSNAGRIGQCRNRRSCQRIDKTQRLSGSGQDRWNTCSIGDGRGRLQPLDTALDVTDFMLISTNSRLVNICSTCAPKSFGGYISYRDFQNLFIGSGSTLIMIKSSQRHRLVRPSRRTYHKPNRHGNSRNERCRKPNRQRWMISNSLSCLLCAALPRRLRLVFPITRRGGGFGVRGRNYSRSIRTCVTLCKLCA